MDCTEQLTCISLCTGYAGLEMGAKRVWPNVRTVVYVEIEAFAVANLVSKMEAGKLDVAPVWTDVKTFTGWPFRDRVHIITAGYPCQPFSVAGKRKGTADPRHLWPDIARIIKAVRPIWCIFENVPGHLGIGFAEVYRSLRDMGYKVEAGLFTAAEVGAPHIRQRLFIMAHSERERYGRCAEETGNADHKNQRNNRQKMGGETDGCLQLAHAKKTVRGRMSEEHAGRGTEEIGRSNESQLADSGFNAGGPVFENQQEERAEELSGSNQLANTESSEGRLHLPERRQKQSISKPERSGEAMADSTALVLQGPVTAGSAQAGRQTDEQGPADRWPARPGRPQYEWEEPRTVMSRADSNFLKGYVEKYQTAITERQAEELAYALDSYAIESAVGKSTHGITNNVNQLRLLGNGVVPQQAEKAIRELSKLIINQ